MVLVNVSFLESVNFLHITVTAFSFLTTLEAEQNEI